MYVLTIRSTYLVEPDPPPLPAAIELMSSSEINTIGLINTNPPICIRVYESVYKRLIRA